LPVRWPAMNSGSASPGLPPWRARDALRGYDREDLVLNLRYAPEAAGRVADMMRKEQACCAFLIFAIHRIAIKCG
jgi:hypothetical protein